MARLADMRVGLLLFFLPVLCSGLSLFPYGEVSGDSMHEYHGSRRVNLTSTVPFPFLGDTENRLQLLREHLIGANFTHIVSPLDFGGSNPSDGTLWTRVEYGSKKIAAEIRAKTKDCYFSANVNFVVTMEDMKYYEHEGTNTFQQVVTSDLSTKKTYWIVKYKDIKVTSESTQGSVWHHEGSLDGEPIFSWTEQVFWSNNEYRSTNVGEPGTWIIRIDQNPAQLIFPEESCDNSV